jgi:nitrite reductase/ring-hydroxylating ferredoxin subunit/predicted HicB family RNase H-like nuclease
MVNGSVMSADEFIARYESQSAENGVSGKKGSRLRVNGAARTRRTSLELPAQLPMDTWKHIGIQISTIYDSVTWWLGDWLIYGEDKYPDRYIRAVSETSFNYQTLRNYAWVARRFRPSRRRDTLSFQHHAEVAALDEAEQDKWLDLAERCGWSRNRLRNHLREDRMQNDSPVDVVLRVRISEEQRRRWEVAAAEARRSLSDWAIDSLNSAARAVPASLAGEPTMRGTGWKKLVAFLGARWYALVRAADLPPGRVWVRKVGRQLVGVAASGDNVYVFDGRCPHAGQSLQDAEVCDSGVVICPRHALKLALKKVPCSAQARPIAQLPFRVRDGVIEVDRRNLRPCPAGTLPAGCLASSSSASRTAASS